MTTEMEIGTVIQVCGIGEHYFQYEGVKYIDLEVVHNREIKYWVPMDSLPSEEEYSENNAYHIQGEVDKLIPMKTSLGEDQRYETVLKNCVFLDAKKMWTFTTLENKERYPNQYIPCEDKNNDFFQSEYPIGRMITTEFEFERWRGPLPNSVVLKEKAKSSNKEHYFILDEDEQYVRLLKAKKDAYIYLIEKEKLGLFFETTNVTMLDSIDKVTFKTVGVNATYSIRRDVFNTHFYYIYLFGKHASFSSNPENAVTFDRQLYKKGKKKNVMEFELYFFGKNVKMEDIRHIQFRKNSTFINYSKEEGQFPLSKAIFIEDKKDVMRKAVLGDETKPHYVENIQHMKLY